MHQLNKENHEKTTIDNGLRKRKQFRSIVKHFEGKDIEITCLSDIETLLF